MTEKINLKYELESVVSNDFLNNNFTLPKSFIEMINKLHKVYDIDKDWTQQIIDENVDWDNEVYEEFSYALKKELSNSLNDIEFEMNFHDLIYDYFYKEEFTSIIYIYGNFDVEVSNSLSMKAYFEGADIDISVHAKEYVKSNLNNMINNQYTELGIVEKRFN